MSDPIKVHLFSLKPGERFRVAGMPDLFSVVAGQGDLTAFLDGTGQPVSSRAIAIANNGSLFVYPITTPGSPTS